MGWLRALASLPPRPEKVSLVINSRNIADLLPRVAAKCSQFINECASIGIDVIITSTYRDNESQAQLYAQGRTLPGNKVTNADAGHSFHNYRVAFDFCPIVNGKAVWNNPELWNRCGRIAEQIGLEWGGAWDRFPDQPHCQDTNGYTIAQYLAGNAK